MTIHFFEGDESKAQDVRFCWGLAIAVVLSICGYIFLPLLPASLLMVVWILLLGPLSAKYGLEFWIPFFRWIGRLIRWAIQ